MNPNTQTSTAARRSTVVELTALMTQLGKALVHLTERGDCPTPSETPEILANLGATCEAIAAAAEHLSDSLAESIIDAPADRAVGSPDQVRHTLGCLRAGASYAHGAGTLLVDAITSPTSSGVGQAQS
jgi:hypothetical protein